ncbi:MAG: iron chelate uptake ABC transporter family permease subunit, partial [Gemmatimonadetes bacterium]|nr:iron chelate uptake ABC transporter family permease subunit [Gemmatimonadota bacterium]
LAVLVGAPLLGSGEVNLSQVFEAPSIDHTILWQLRLPRVILALAGGAALAMAGAAFQTLFRNSLAEPYT